MDIIPLRIINCHTADIKYKQCPNCHGFYVKSSLRKHYIKCSEDVVKGEKRLFQLSRKLTDRCHTIANDVKNEIFSVLIENFVSDIVKLDELSCIYANKMSLKYRRKHHHKMIRARLRLMGRLLFEVKKEDNSITDLSSIFCPKHFDNIILAVNKVAG